MGEKIRGIVLNVRKHNERNQIVTLYTRERGRLAFISPIGSGKAMNARRARLQPMSVISTEFSYKTTSELQRLGSIATDTVWHDIYFHPQKRVLALFLSEFLYRLLNATMPDPALFDFIVSSLRHLDDIKSGIADFHIPFLVELLRYTGIQPDISGWREGYVFDFPAGAFVAEEEAKGPMLKGEEAKAVGIVARINFRNIKSLRLTNLNRRQILYGLLNYYSFHIPGLGSLKSPEVLREIFN